MRIDRWGMAIVCAVGLSVAGVSLAEPGLQAQLISADEAARKGSATVSVLVSGLELVDPAQVEEKPRAGQGHLHYQVDEGVVIATTTTKLSFHELAAGRHRIKVTLVGNDHKPLGPHETLQVTIPPHPEHGAM